MAKITAQDLTYVQELLPFIDFTDPQKALPAIAKSAQAHSVIASEIASLRTRHKIVQGDARKLDFIQDKAVHLVITSPPYWDLKKYPSSQGQLGNMPDYDAFLDELDNVWRECYRVLVPGGRLVIVVGDVCRSRRRFGRHLVVPLHASIQERCMRIGFDNLAPIFWYKIANASHEVENGSSFLGKPYEPNAVIKNDVEYILMQRKPGGYRTPSLKDRVLSVIPDHEYQKWFRQIWADLPGASTRRHPAPFPEELAHRLIRMFSFTGDTVLDPFAGTGTTTVAAARAGRCSMGVELEGEYVRLAADRAIDAGIRLDCISDSTETQRVLLLE